MNHLAHDLTGYLHLISSVLALIFGTSILIMKKGTALHKKIGYGYVVSMVILLATSFMIYRLFGGFGLFHIFSVIGTVTLVGGMLPAILRKPADWVELHFHFMYWLVIGLYGAFVSEVLTRVPETPFYSMLGAAVFAVMGLGFLFWFWKKGKWSEEFKAYAKEVSAD